MRRLAWLIHPGGMVRRSSNRFKADDLAYPIRVKFVVPEGGMRSVGDRLEKWLGQELEPAAWSWGPAHSPGCRQATAYYFRRLEDAQRALAAFPELELADGVQDCPRRSGNGDGGFRTGPGWTGH